MNELAESIGTKLVDARVSVDVLEDTILNIMKTLSSYLEQGDVQSATNLIRMIISHMEPTEDGN